MAGEWPPCVHKINSVDLFSLLELRRHSSVVCMREAALCVRSLLMMSLFGC